jgi:hypothetical protein
MRAWWRAIQAAVAAFWAEIKWLVRKRRAK